MKSITAIVVFSSAAFTSAMNFPQCRETDPNMEYFCPTSRYCEWEPLPGPTRSSLRDELKYLRKSWDYLNGNVNEFETTSFDSLNGGVKGKYEQMGFEEDTFDCCLNHYDFYDWADFAGEDFVEVREALEILGYNKNKWDNDVALEFDDNTWDSLSPEYQEALSELCWSKGLWDGVDLTLWTEDTALPGSFWTDEEIAISVTTPTSDVASDLEGELSDFQHAQCHDQCMQTCLGY